MLSIVWVGTCLVPSPGGYLSSAKSGGGRGYLSGAKSGGGQGVPGPVPSLVGGGGYPNMGAPPPKKKIVGNFFCQNFFDPRGGGVTGPEPFCQTWSVVSSMFAFV